MKRMAAAGWTPVQFNQNLTRIALKTSLPPPPITSLYLLPTHSTGCVIGQMSDMTEWSICLWPVHGWNTFHRFVTHSIRFVGSRFMRLFYQGCCTALLRIISTVVLLAIVLHQARGRNDTKGFFFTPDLLWTSVHPSIHFAVTTCPALRVTERLRLVPGHCGVTAGLGPGHTRICAHMCAY